MPMSVAVTKASSGGIGADGTYGEGAPEIWQTMVALRCQVVEATVLERVWGWCWKMRRKRLSRLVCSGGAWGGRTAPELAREACRGRGVRARNLRSLEAERRRGLGGM